MPGCDPVERRAVYFEMIDVLARLHNTDVEAAGLSDFGKPGNYFGRQVDRWPSAWAPSIHWSTYRISSSAGLSKNFVKS